MSKILVVGGAGYIGSHMINQLSSFNHDIVVFDNLSSGHRDAAHFGEFVYGDLSDVNSLQKLFQGNNFDAVMHFASYIQVGESTENPGKYYKNNVSNTVNLLDVMVEYGVKKFVFSSTAAIFGNPEYVPIDEKHPQVPVNPYGRTKLFVEDILKDFDKAHGMKSICLRYFNAAGSDPSGLLGERHSPETHLIPLVLQVALGERDAITVFGDDYNTDDGTCIRDYIHVYDLCSAHLLALDLLESSGSSAAFNLGSGIGYSVKQVIEMCRTVTGKPIPVIQGLRREGDPDALVADSRNAVTGLGWTPKYDSLRDIVEHAWLWSSSNASKNDLTQPADSV